MEARAVLRAAASTDWPARSELAMRERRWKDALEILDANAKQVQEVERVQFDLRHAASEAMSLPGPSPACARFAAALNAMQTRSFFALYRNERSRITAEMRARCR